MSDIVFEFVILQNTCYGPIQGVNWISAVDTAIHQRLTNARARLRSAVDSGLVPVWLSQTAQRCLIDLDCALGDGMSSTRARMLLAQIDALTSVVGELNRPRSRGDADSR